MQTRNNRPDNGQRNDCTVRAFASACNMDYWTVLQTLRAAGRRDNAGFNFKTWLEREDDKAFGCVFTRVEHYGGPGVFMISNCGHVATVINGVKLDADGGLTRGMRPKWAWKVQRKAYEWTPPDQGLVSGPGRRRSGTAAAVAVHWSLYRGPGGPATLLGD